MSYNYNSKCNCNNTNEVKKCENSLCCDGLSKVKFNVAKAKTICAYVDRIYDGKSGSGSPLFHALTTNATDYISTLSLKPLNENCCTTCAVGDDALFFVDNCPTVELLDINVVTAPTPAKVLVNGAAVAAVADLGNSDYKVTLLDANIINIPECEGTGKKSTLMLDTIGTWTYRAKYKLNGTMNYSGQTCKFEAVIESTIDVAPDTAASTLIVQELCIPSKEAKINLSIGGKISIINPQLSYDPVANAPILKANIVIIPTVDAEVIENKKVCMQAMVE
ncbi:MAG: hypothetical protein ACRC28_11630 [Clostridium sp.]|uniref:hypothetical protein n=1 Tax=Clostridium sp. TaxID=1506 RepID=UPI003F31490F